MEKITDEQIENWREALVSVLGPYALIMPKEQIEKLRDKLQWMVDRTEKPSRRD